MGATRKGASERGEAIASEVVAGIVAMLECEPLRRAPETRPIMKHERPRLLDIEESIE